MIKKLITLIEYYYHTASAFYSYITTAQMNFFMQSDAYIPEKMVFRNIKVNGKGKQI